MSTANTLSRRRFCAGTGAGLLVLGAGGCDAGTHSDGDLGTSTLDLNCPTTGCSVVNCGAASALGLNQAMHFTDSANYDFYLCRDAGGLFSVDAQCTHNGCDVRLTGGQWSCPCHGATYHFDGTAPTAPAPTPLNNYAIAIDGAGMVSVDYSKVVSSTQRA